MDSEIVWQIPEYEYRRKNSSWLWASLVVALILIIFAGWQRNFLFAIFVGIAFFLVNFMANRFPPIWRFRLNNQGVFIESPDGKNKKPFLFEKIEGFDIHNIEGEDYQNLILKIKGKFSPFLKINIYSDDSKDIEKFLSKFIKREEYPRQLTDSLADLVGF